MHVPEGHEAPSGVREFLRAYAMIVLSILTALAFERAAVAVHDASAAQASRARIEAEIAVNIADLTQALDSDRAVLTSNQSLVHEAVTALKAGRSDDAALTAKVDGFLQHNVTLLVPSWQRDSWDAALADQTASHLAASDLRRYAELYATARDAQDLPRLLISGGLIDAVVEHIVDAQTGRTDLRRGTILLTRFQAVASQIVSAETQVLDLAQGRKPGSPPGGQKQGR